MFMCASQLWVLIILVILVVWAQAYGPGYKGRRPASSAVTTYSPTNETFLQTCENDDRVDICVSKECVFAANSLLSAMNTSVNPCEDFYQFACGGWLESHDISPSRLAVNQFSIIYDRLVIDMKKILEEAPLPEDPLPLNSVKDLYKSCLNLDVIEQVGLEPLLSLLNEFGGWPMASKDWNFEEYDWLSVIAYFKRKVDRKWIIGMDVYEDYKHPLQRAVHFSAPQLILNYNVLLDSFSYPKIINAFMEYVGNASLVIAKQSGVTLDLDVLEVDIIDLLNFEIDLAWAIVNTTTDWNDLNALYNVFKLNELSNITGSVIDWERYLHLVFLDIENVTIATDERVIVEDPLFLPNLVELLQNTPIRTIANYLGFRIIVTLASLLSSEISDLDFKFYSAQFGIKERPARWIDCVGESNNLMGMAISYAYVQNVFNLAGKVQAEVMIRYLFGAFRTFLDQATWMDEETKKGAREKINSFISHIGFPDWLFIKGKLEAYYLGISTNSSTYLENVVIIHESFVTTELNNLRVEVDRTSWITFPTVVNAYYYSLQNSISFPAAILQPPFFYELCPMYLNFGGIGMVIGHEITHGFDDTGRQFDKDGGLNLWWTNATLENFNKKKQCFIDQYSQYQLPQLIAANAPVVNVSGWMTQGENIADNGGSRQMSKGYFEFVKENGKEPLLPGLMDFTQEQLMYISYGNIWCEKMRDEYAANLISTNSHSPGMFRVNGVLSNNIDFAYAFNCPVGSKMNPKKKCVLW